MLQSSHYYMAEVLHPSHPLEQKIARKVGCIMGELYVRAQCASPLFTRLNPFGCGGTIHSRYVHNCGIQGSRPGDRVVVEGDGYRAYDSRTDGKLKTWYENEGDTVVTGLVHDHKYCGPNKVGIRKATNT